MTAPSARERLIAALAVSDAERRVGRAERIEWVSLHDRRPGMMFGRSETMRLLSEAVETFIDGHFVGALLLATSFIEHTLSEELQSLGLATDSTTFGQAIGLAKKHKAFPQDWLERTDALRLKRNPFAHLKEEGHKHSMGVRWRKQKVHPLRMIEADAKGALELIFDYLSATVREADV